MLQNWEFSIETGVNGKICFDDVTRHLIVFNSHSINLFRFLIHASVGGPLVVIITFIMHLYERTNQIPKRDEQISSEVILLVLKTGLTSFSHEISFVHNLFILQLIATKFSRGLVGGKSLVGKIWLP